MKILSRNELATIKRTAKNVSGMRAKKAKLEDKISTLQAELDTVNEVIDSFELPIVKMTGGFTSEQVLAGEMEIAASLEATQAEGEVSEEVVDVVETPVEGAVYINPEVKSPLEAANPFAGTTSTSDMPFAE